MKLEQSDIMTNTDTMENFQRNYRKNSQNESMQSQTTENNSDDIKKLLIKIQSSLEYIVTTMKKDTITKKFDTGIQTLPVAIINIPDPDNTTTGYTALNIYNIIERNANEIYFINQGPGPIYVLRSEKPNSFSQTEVPIFPGQRKVFFNVYELRFRTTVAGTNYTITEHPTDLIINNFDDRVATPAHVFFGLDTFGPHGATVRATYTVPTGYKAKINGCYVYIEIDSPAAVPSRRNVTIIINSPTIGGLSVMSRTFGDNENADGAVKEGELGFAYTLLTGESVDLVTQDNSTGGFVSYFSSVEITQYFSYPT